MKALDTNVLVRFLVRDDEEQAGRVLDLHLPVNDLVVECHVPIALGIGLAARQSACERQPGIDRIYDVLLHDRAKPLRLEE